MSSASSIRPHHHPQHPASPPAVTKALTAIKALALVAAVWGLLYPGLLWSLEQLLHGR